MWPNTALQALGVLVLFTVTTTVVSEFGTPVVPGDVGHSGNEKTEAEFAAATSTATIDFEEYFKVNLSSGKSLSDDEIISTSPFAIYTPTGEAVEDTKSRVIHSNMDFGMLNNLNADPGTLHDQLIEAAADSGGESNVENRMSNQWITELINVSDVPYNSEPDIGDTASLFDEIFPPENVRAISFQIPTSNYDSEKSSGPEAVGEQHKSVPNFLTDIKNPSVNSKENWEGQVSKESHQNVVSDTINLKDKTNDRSRQQKNQLNPKATKAFYEIKSLLTTEAAAVDVEDSQDPNVHANVRKFVLPTIPWKTSAMGKYGPYFEDGPEEINITARIGSTVYLDCKIGMLHDKTVTWLQHSKDSIHLLTVARQVYSADQRVSLSFRYPSNWRLQILYASVRDSGLYECQVATHPPRSKKFNLIVTAPVLTIVDDAGRVVAAGERHLKAGSVLKLSCEARDIREEDGESVVWTRGDETLVENVSENKTRESIGREEVRVVVSTVSVDRATPRHAGNYSCSVPGRTKSTVAVHVLNGELPAAVHDGNGVSRAVLNLWLVHLTISYVFSR